ncbi:MAG: imidazole glycerol phosphate synthase subunit HisF, partial [Methanobacteriota archaeon]
MLTKRIIPCLDVTNGRVVKGINFADLRDAGDPVNLGSTYWRKGADELVYLDITATSDNQPLLLDLIGRIAQKIFIPFTIGGGIKSIEDMSKILSAGADKISINSATVSNPNLIEEGAKLFGSQCIVVAVDVKKEKGKWKVYT